MIQEQLLNSSNAFKVIGVGRVLDNLLSPPQSRRILARSWKRQAAVGWTQLLASSADA